MLVLSGSEMLVLGRFSAPIPAQEASATIFSSLLHNSRKHLMEF